MELLIQTIIFSISFVILAKSSHFVVNSSVELVKITKLGEIVIGFIILSIATNIPEIGVAFAAIISGKIGITVGNILGSSVANIGLVIGVMCILTVIKITRGTLMKLSAMLFLSSLVPLILLQITMSKTVGIVLLFTFLGFCYYSVRKRITLEKVSREQKPDFFRAIVTTIKYYKTFLTLFLGLAGVLISSWFVVESASKIAIDLGIAKTVIGATIISIGTSLPELAVGISSIKQGYLKLALGDIIGSCLTKLTLVLGFVLFFSPITISLNELTPIITFVLISNIFLWFFLERGKLDQAHGFLLLAVYLAFVITVFGIEIAV